MCLKATPRFGGSSARPKRLQPAAKRTGCGHSPPAHRPPTCQDSIRAPSARRIRVRSRMCLKPTPRFGGPSTRPKRLQSAAKRGGSGHSPPRSEAGVGIARPPIVPQSAKTVFERPPREEYGSEAEGASTRHRVSEGPPPDRNAFSPPRSEVGVGTAHRKRGGCWLSPPRTSCRCLGR